MFEDKTQEQARQQILESVKAYWERFLDKKTEYRQGDAIPYAGRVFDSHEMCRLADSMLDFWLTAGRYTERFEQSLAKYLGVRYCAFANSGSSANLLAFMALTSPLLGERQIRRGDEVITTAACFPTTVSPIIQYGAVPVFVDVEFPSGNIDVSMLEKAYTKKTKAVMAAHTLGNPFHLKDVKAFCDRHGLWLVEDNCDALGSVYEIDGQKRLTGTVGDLGTSSFYPPHHITTGEGGAVYTDHPLLAKIVRSLRDWGRDCVCPPGTDGMCQHRFDRKYGQLPHGYDHKYVYSHLGYNLKATDMQAAVGCAQLEKLDAFTQRRRHNFDRLREKLQPAAEKLVLPEAAKHTMPSWFGFLTVCKPGVERSRIVKYLEQHGVQTRMLFAGNLIRHPCFDQMRADGTGYRVVGGLPHTERLMKDAFWVGVYPGITDEMIDDMAGLILEAVENESKSC
ncbi:MAG: lipopolysaccharide biosynthesis protein RfbH [Eubacterium sp.]|nr:lipopolysaccharide biosynthesis protein RfbH [Eubacterium sp.]